MSYVLSRIILNLAKATEIQHDLIIFISIDGSLDEDGIVTVSISIIAPDIQESDITLEWKDRIAKVLLMRSWRLPSVWGTSKVCITMAESIRFILGDYTIPAHIPVIYITDSNNARTLQRHTESSIDNGNDELSYTPNECLQIQKKKSRFTFNHSIYDFLGNIIILKVFSHQLNKDFEVAIMGKSPQPNMFIASANQTADNAANQAHHLAISTHTEKTMTKYIIHRSHQNGL
jgi:hypothetical protein